MKRRDFFSILGGALAAVAVPLMPRARRGETACPHRNKAVVYEPKSMTWELGYATQIMSRLEPSTVCRDCGVTLESGFTTQPHRVPDELISDRGVGYTVVQVARYRPKQFKL